MTPSSTDLVIKALDGLSLRATVTAQNIANAGTPDYRPLHVSFESALKAAALRGREAVRDLPLQAEVDTSASNRGGVRLDLELADASATATRYTALIDILSRQLQLDSLAITGNP